MSTFRGIIKEIEGISVDQFEGQNLESRVFFLSHCHSDHMAGINSESFFNHLHLQEFSIYASEISCLILKNKHPRLSKHVKALSIEETHTILIPKTPRKEDKYISVSLIPAGHCPGSVMFLFRTTDRSTVLYTGDFRLYPRHLSMIRKLRTKTGELMAIDKMYFDSTFWNNLYPDFPSRESSSNTISDISKEWISKGEEYIVNLNIPAYFGSEYLYKDVSNKLKMPIHVHENVYDSYRQIADMEGVFTKISKNTQIHSCTSIRGCGMRKLVCRKNEDLKIRHIRPSAQKWTNFNNDTSGLFSEEASGFYVCYSSHCSFNELKAFIQYLKPKSIEPCVVPGFKNSRLDKENISIQKDFYESINEFCKQFLKMPCTLSESKEITEMEEEEHTLIGTSNDQVIVSHSIPVERQKIIYADSDEEPPIKSSRLLTLKPNFC